MCQKSFAGGDCLTSYGRILLGIVFIASGLMKGVNLHSFAHTIRMFGGLFGIDVVSGIPAAFAICFFETLIGFLALDRQLFIRLYWLYALIMGVFTWITYINLVNPYGGIESCGCFGEIIHLNPSETFWKNIVLLAVVLFLTVRIMIVKGIGSTSNDADRSTSLSYVGCSIVAALIPLLFSLLFMDHMSPEWYSLIYILISTGVDGLIVFSVSKTIIRYRVNDNGNFYGKKKFNCNDICNHCHYR